MKVIVKKGVLADTKSQAIILPVFEDSKKLTGIALDIDKISGGFISDVISSGDFAGKPSQISAFGVKSLLLTFDCRWGEERGHQYKMPAFFVL